MSDQRDTPTRRRWSEPLAFLLLYLLTYVLAPGPINWLYTRGYISQGSLTHKACLIVHRPLIRLMSKSEAEGGEFSKFMDWWMELGEP